MGNPVRDMSHISLVQVVDDTGAPVSGGGGGGGDASAANQVTGNNSLSSIDTKLTSQATAANQTTGNASLSSLDTKITATNTKLDTLITAMVAANASLDDIEAAAENTAPTLTSRAPYTIARPITPNTNVTAGQGVLIACTVAGNQVLELSSGNTITVPVVPGASFIDNIAVIDAPSAGTTATATVTVLAVS